MQFSPIPIAGLSIILMLLSIALPAFYLPSKEEKEGYRQHKIHLGEKQSIDTEITSIEKSLAVLKQTKTDLQSSLALKEEQGRAKEQEFISEARDCFSTFKSHNLKHRPDSLRPDCYIETYPFPFTTYFTLNDQAQ